MPANTAIVIEPLEYIREFNSQRVSVPLSVSKNWLRHVFRVNTERLHIGAVSAPCKETLAAQGIENLTHMSSDSVESLWGCGSDPTPGFFDRLGIRAEARILSLAL